MLKNKKAGWHRMYQTIYAIRLWFKLRFHRHKWEYGTDFIIDRYCIVCGKVEYTDLGGYN